MMISTSVSSTSGSSNSSIGDKCTEPAKKGKSDLKKEAKTPSKNHSVSLGRVHKAPSSTDAETEKVGSGSPSDEEMSGSHDDTLGVNLSPRRQRDSDDEPDPPHGPKKKPQKSIAVDLDAAISSLPQATTEIHPSSVAYDALKASWPGAAAYASSFMLGRVAQFALTVSGYPVGSAMAFATLAGTLNLAMEPVVVALRSKMGMRSERDSKNFTNFVTAVAIHVDSSIRNDAKGVENAEKLARESLAPYYSGWDKQNDAMPGIWDQARTMLLAGARGYATNELPFFVFSAVYMLTNPAGLWVRSELLAAHAGKDTATIMELLMSVLGGAIAGIGTVGVQNALRTAIQGMNDAPARKTIKLAELNGGILKVTQHQLTLLKTALKKSLKEGAEPEKSPDVQQIEASISEALRLTGARDQDTVDTILVQVNQLPLEAREQLLGEVRVKLGKDKPYSLSDAIATNYKEMVATRDDSGIYQSDTAKQRKLAARLAMNVLSLMAYSSALLPSITAIAQYGPANVSPMDNTTGADGQNAYPTTHAEAYGAMAGLGWALIAFWNSRVLLAPAAELAMAPVTGAASRVGSAVKEAATQAASWIRSYFAPDPVTNAPSQEDTPPPSGVDHV